MAELKTQRNKASVTAFLNGIEDDAQRKDAKTLLKMMKSITNAKPEMWGTTIVGFGQYRYQYASGRAGEWFKVGFSPRKTSLTLYMIDGANARPKLLKKLGKYKTGKSCLYIKRLSDIDVDVLREMIEASVTHLDDKYG